ncbi:hypothetical protein [Nonomuraea polychroma]|uniref:hypothetical protein n=1 Tax=Nonomuraea polychroma TaxID=46176 RepID=UPI000FDF3667|nr:hypothetical protein [Nonomuraea polychroma]
MVEQSARETDGSKESRLRWLLAEGLMLSAEFKRTVDIEVLIEKRDEAIGRPWGGLACPSVNEPGCVKKTFPGFHEALAGLRAAWIQN